MTLEEKIAAFPQKPGVYLFKDTHGDVLYVGKAIRLRDRVRSYVTGRDTRPQIAVLLKQAVDIEYIVTDTEREALLLENTLIKKHRPRYNISLRDDKSYISIRVGMEHESPGIGLTRRVKKDGAAYFGPYASAQAAREAVEQITRFFQLRTCRDREYANRARACIKYDIGRCTAPCVGTVSKQAYAAQVEQALMFLSGRSRELIHILEARMHKASEALRYEEAARCRDALSLIKGLSEKQGVVSHAGGDHDAIGLARLGSDAALCVLEVRSGALTEKRSIVALNACGDDAQLVEELILARYAEASKIPPKIYVQSKPEGMAELESLLSERRNASVELHCPVRGEMLRLVELARENALESLASQGARREEADVLARLARHVKARGPIERIECVDISTTSGREAVGSLVAFQGTEPEKSGYRLYNIQTKETPDDYAMMFEVLSRRFNPEVPIRAKGVKRPPPDLLLVDGGKGQLAVAVRALAECGVTIAVAAIAKGEEKGHADQVYIPGRKNPLNLKRGSRELLLLMKIRDEAHRFGVAAHRRRRGKISLT